MGARTGLRPEGAARTEATFNYFRGRPAQWKTGVPSFSAVRYRQVWPGIDVVFRGKSHLLKYEYRLEAGADPEAIRMRVRGAKSLRIDDAGQLVAETAAGLLADQRPYAYQVIDGQKVQVPCAYRLLRNASGAPEYAFTLGEYDRSRPLVLDPAFIIYCGFVGDQGVNGSLAVAVDADGNLFVGGFVYPAPDGLPLQVGPFLTTVFGGGGSGTGWIAKVKADGSGILYCGYLGGYLDAVVTGIAVDNQDSAYLCGYTYAGGGEDLNGLTFPTKIGPMLTVSGSTYDGFVTKLTPDGSGLVYSGFIGGNKEDYAFAIAVDAQGSAYVAGQTQGGTFPVVTGPGAKYRGDGVPTSSTWKEAYQTYGDAFICKVAPKGNGFIYSGYIGGSGADWAQTVAVDAQGHAFVAGVTNSKDLPVFGGPELTFPIAQYTGWLAEVETDGSRLLTCGYFGSGSGNATPPAAADILGIAVDASGSIYLAGVVIGDGVPVTRGPTTAVGVGAFVAKLGPGAQGPPLYSFLIDGALNDYAADIALDSAGHAYVCGNTGSDATSFPVKNGPPGAFIAPEVADEAPTLWVARVAADGSDLDYCGYLGGKAVGGSAIAVDQEGNAYVAASASFDQGLSFPVAVGPALTHSGENALVAKIAYVTVPSAPTGLTVSPPADPAGRSQLSLAWTDTSTEETTWLLQISTDAGKSWSDLPQLASTSRTQVGVSVSTTVSGLKPSTSYTFHVAAANLAGASAWSAPASAATLAVPPAAASSLTAQLTAPDTISLSWKDNSSGQAGFTLLRSAKAFTDGGTPIAALGPGSVSYSDARLPANTVFSYRVVAFVSNPDGVPAAAPASNTAQAMTAALTPTSLKATAVSSSEIDLSWQDANPASSTSNFELFRSADGGKTYPSTPTAKVSGVTSGGSVTYADQALAANSPFFYKVRAVALPPSGVTGGGPSAFAGPVSATTLPAPVTSLTVSAIPGTTGLHLAWKDPNPGGAAAKLERSTDAFASDDEKLGSVPAGSTGYDDQSTLGNSTYSYRVTASNASGDATAVTASGLSLSAAPAKLTAVVPTDGQPKRGVTQVDLSWQDSNPTPADTQIERSSDGGKSFTLVTVVKAPGTTYTDTGRTPDTGYVYRAAGKNASGLGAYSLTAGAHTLKAPPPPPTGLGVTVASATELDLAWTDGGGSEDGLRLDRQAPGATSYTPLVTLPAHTTSYQDRNLIPASTYAYRVVAFSNGGDSAPPAAGSGTTLPLPPGAPAGLTVSVPPAPQGQTQLLLSWTDASTNEDRFLLQQSADGGKSWSDLPAVPTTDRAGTGAVLKVTASSLQPNHAYRFRVASANIGGQSAWVGPQGATTLPLPPSAPSGLTVSTPAAPAGQSQLLLTWTDTSANETAWVLQRSGDGGKSWTALPQLASSTMLASGESVSFTDSGLVANASYSYRVAALNAGGQSAWAGPQSGTTLPLPPSPPVNLQLQVESSSWITVRWTDASTNEDRFLLERSADGGKSWTALPAIPTPNVGGTGETVSDEDHGLTAKTSYLYRVRAVNAGGMSAIAGPVSGETTGAGRLEVTPRKLPFGSVVVGKAKSATVTLHNAGKQPVGAEIGAAPGEFSANESGWVRIAGGKSVKLKVTFAPSAPGKAGGPLVITSDDPKAASVPVKLTGTGKAGKK